jgi:hypothetical protein
VASCISERDRKASTTCIIMLPMKKVHLWCGLCHLDLRNFAFVISSLFNPGSGMMQLFLDSRLEGLPAWNVYTEF